MDAPLVSGQTTATPKVSPVLQFISLLAPVVLTGFYLVYGLVGLVIEGQSKIKWSDEALIVGLRVLLLIVLMNVLVMAYAFFKKVPKNHLLWISPVTHIAIGVILTVIIAVIL